MKYDCIFKNTVDIVDMVVIVTIVTYLWGSAFPFIKLSYPLLDIQLNETFEQLLFAGYRFFLASLITFLFMFIKERRVFFSI
ncbi:hypothetical protein EDD72_10324 [Tepidibacillus fermentans]|uniref:EamA-like transporter family protein n=1 Tax=Tepidibacillus fermentans TaxID=1281767 RepID=A0A4R3KLI0_9BACI|nr:hypothetical protein EDD72_10324 [Tepidibacillus fermentans]